MIEKIKKMTVAFILLTMTLTAHAENESEFNWDAIVDAIVQVESGGRANAVNGKCVGYMQICPALVQECNKIMKKRGINKHFTLADRHDREKSKEMFIIMQSEYNKDNNVEKAIKSWNGGIHYKECKQIQRYYQKVMSHLK